MVSTFHLYDNAFFSFKKLITSLFRLLNEVPIYERVPVTKGRIVIQAERIAL
jgi:hypothetical protein